MTVPPHLFPFTAMASACEIQLAGDTASARAMANRAMTEVRRIEAKYSRYRPDSVVGRINAAAGGEPVSIDEETSKLLDYADAVWRSSGGRFDMTSGVLRRAWDFKSGRLPAQTQLDALLPLVGWDKVERGPGWVRLSEPGMELDFGGFGKEYAVDCAADLCAAAGWQHGLVNLGGDLRVLGPQADGSAWHIGIRHPRAADSVLATVALVEGALASSGDYERFMEVDGQRYCHILDPRTGWPVHGWQSVSVTASRCLVAGSISTVGMLHDLNDSERWLRGLGLPVLAAAEGDRLVNTFAST
jgi:thiamine biosynthesis lipoprotein